MSQEVWAALVGIAGTAILGAAGWMLSIHAKVSAIAEDMKGITQLWERSESHEKRLGRHDERLDDFSEKIQEHATAIHKLRTGTD